MKRFAYILTLLVLASIGYGQIKISADFNLPYLMDKRPQVDTVLYLGYTEGHSDTTFRVAYDGRDTISTRGAFLVGFVVNRVLSADTIVAYNGADTMFVCPIKTTEQGRRYDFGAVCDTSIIVTKKTDSFLTVIWRK